MATPLPPDPTAKLKQLRALATLLDEAISIPGTDVRVGLDGLLGLAPVIGDVLTALASAYIINESAKLGVPKPILWRMVFNAGLDLLGGAIPVAGDVFDVAWKANKKNVDLLEAYLKPPRPPEPYIDV